MDPRASLLQRPTSVPPTTPSIPTALERDLKPCRSARLFPLLLMTIYAAGSILRITSTSSSRPVLPALPNSPIAVREKAKDSGPLQTRLISTRHASLHASQEGTPPASVAPCSALIDGDASSATAGRGRGASAGAVLCCDRSHFRTDVCYLRGDVRTHSPSSSIFVRGTGERHGHRLPQMAETIRPYTRKWEVGIMSTIDELKLIPDMPSEVNGSATCTRCDVRHDVPAVVFSTGGYTGNVYHEFSDGLLPLYATAERFRGEVVLVVLEYHSWWVAKYGSVVRSISNYRLVNFARDRRVHCFPEMIVGLRIHGELTIDPKVTPTGKGIRDFQELLGQSFGRSRRKEQRPSPLLLPANSNSISSSWRRRQPKLVILVRNRARLLLNLRQVVKASQSVGFKVQVLNPKRGTPMADIYEALHSADAMMAVHGAAVTHFLFMRPGSVLIQIVPLGLDRPAKEFYGQPARALGLEYMEYKVLPEESSLSRYYDRRDPVIVDPLAISRKGWSELKRVYLDQQDVKVNLRRFRKVLAGAYYHAITSQQPIIF